MKFLKIDCKELEKTNENDRILFVRYNNNNYSNYYIGNYINAMCYRDYEIMSGIYTHYMILDKI